MNRPQEELLVALFSVNSHLGGRLSRTYRSFDPDPQHLSNFFQKKSAPVKSWNGVLFKKKCEQVLLPEGLEWSVARLWTMIGATRNICPEFLPGQAVIQAESGEEAEMS
jgi:hypothetical protein